MADPKHNSFTSFRTRSNQSGRNNNQAMNSGDELRWMYEMQFIELAANRFEWEGLPKEIDKRFLEIELFYRSLCVFFKDDEVGKYKALRGSGVGQLDWYDNPTTFNVVGNIFGVKTIEAENCVPIWGNYMRYPDHRKAMIFANQMAEIDRTIEINIAALRYTKLVAAKENSRLSMANIMRQQQEGQPVIYATKAFDPADISVLDLGVDHEVIPSLLIARSKIWNNAMTMMGIDNANQDKKERLVSDEVAANEEQVEVNRNIALNAREQACEKMKELYGLDVTVRFKSAIKGEEPPLSIVADDEGEENENGDIHDDVSRSA